MAETAPTPRHRNFYTLLYIIRGTPDLKKNGHFPVFILYVPTAKVLKKVDISVILQHFLRQTKDLTVVKHSYLIDYQ